MGLKEQGLIFCTLLLISTLGYLIGTRYQLIHGKMLFHHSPALLVGILSIIGPTLALIGFDHDMYNPSCAYACRAVIGSAMIECPDSPSHHTTHTMKKRHGHASPITPECRSINPPFLSTLAFCIDQRCSPFNNVTTATSLPSDDLPTKSRLEWYFAIESTGDKAIPPMWSFAQALQAVNNTPNATYDAIDMQLRTTMLIDTEAWRVEKQSLESFRAQEVLHSYYSVAIICIAIGIPILLLIGSYLPYGTWTRRWLSPRWIEPALWRGRVIRPIYRVFNLPTLGQSGYIALMTVLTLVLSFVKINPVLPHTWFADRTEQTTAYIANRTGMISMALMPVTILFAGRNNILLYCTGWSYSTYLLFHRWIARLCVLEAIIHSIAELRMYVIKGTILTEQQELYWIWGSVATVAGCIMLIASIPRRFYYEIFLITHILLAVFFIAGTWYHVVYLFDYRWGYEYWIYACCAVWFVDRIIRVWRIVKNGIKIAEVSLVGEELVRVDIPGVRWNEAPGQHAFVYLPALRRFAPWENHPFSIIPTGMLRLVQVNQGIPSKAAGLDGPIEEKEMEEETIRPANGIDHDSSSASSMDRLEQAGIVAQTQFVHLTYRLRPKEKGVTLFIRRHAGITVRLNTLTSPRITALLDGPYHQYHHSPILKVDRLILIAGGIGITAVLPYLPHHRNISLHWSIRLAQQPIIQHIVPALAGLGESDKEILIDKRIDLRDAIEKEIRDGWSLIGVLVCGPAGMCDDVRQEVVRLGIITTARIELQVEAFSW